MSEVRWNMTAIEALEEMLNRFDKEDSHLSAWVAPIVRKLQVEIERERFLCGETNGIPAYLAKDPTDEE